MKVKRRIAIVVSLLVMVTCLSLSVGYAWTKTDEGDKNFNIGYASVRGYGKAYCKTGTLYDTCKAEFFFYENSIGVTEEADVLNSVLAVSVYKYRNNDALQSVMYSNHIPKPNDHYESTKHKYSSSWCYRANGTKTVITCEYDGGDDGGPASYVQYTYCVH